MRTSVVPPYCCYLRVYEPLPAFPARERTSWEAEVCVPEHPKTGFLAVVEQRESLAALLPAMPPGAVSAARRAYSMEVEGNLLLCPDESALRVRQALGDLMTSLPEHVLQVLLPAGGLDRVDFGALQDEACPPDAEPHILTARWHVPLAWFVIFSDEDRSIGMDPVELRYRTPMVEARRRLGRAHRLLSRQRPEWELEPLRTLGRWIESFHPHGWVELDYGGLVHLMDPDTLAADRSASDVTAALHAVAQGDDEEAITIYHRLRKRWWELRVKERAS
ncbi:hypothetical protein [Actinopolymorpha pittospori]|uniref:DUF8083 domain-containing protein n=1 Tax=Actinopolymorpha pittospori TaxID=648752 RepID=A0A927R7A8_9ACTN|nr:hypothetical protein [Actinopolymorpha pittospori]MBE1605372.1 hypothetical protein [Actinopolymorpha pittospori]